MNSKINNVDCGEVTDEHLELRHISCSVRGDTMKLNNSMESLYFEPIKSSMKSIQTPIIISNSKFLFFEEVSLGMQNGKQIYIHKNAIKTRKGSKSNELSLRGVIAK